MPAAFPASVPTIPTTPVTAQMRDALRAIVGEKGLVEDAHGMQPFVTDWRGLLTGGAGAVVRPGSTPAKSPNAANFSPSTSNATERSSPSNSMSIRSRKAASGISTNIVKLSWPGPGIRSLYVSIS